MAVINQFQSFARHLGQKKIPKKKVHQIHFPERNLNEVPSRCFAGTADGEHKIVLSDDSDGSEWDVTY